MRISLTVARAADDGDGMIPLAVAGLEPLFFFGTLMDIDVLAAVLARPVDPADLAPASLPGFARMRAAAASYPILVRDPDDTADGRLLRRTGRRDIARINHFESEEYAAERHLVRTGEGIRPAWLYASLDVAHMRPSGEPWRLRHWQASAKAAFLDAIDGWMADFAEPR